MEETTEYEHQEVLSEDIFETPSYVVNVIFDEKESVLVYGISNKKYDVVEYTTSFLSTAIFTAKSLEKALSVALSSDELPPALPVGFGRAN